MPKRRQAIVWTNADPIYWRIYATLGGDVLTHWGRVTHICVSKLAIIGSDNGLSPDRRQAIIWTNAGILLIGPLGTNFSEILIEIQTFSFKKMHLKMSSVKRRPFCLGLNVLSQVTPSHLTIHYPSILSTGTRYSNELRDLTTWQGCTVLTGHPDRSSVMAVRWYAPLFTARSTWTWFVTGKTLPILVTKSEK